MSGRAVLGLALALALSAALFAAGCLVEPIAARAGEVGVAPAAPPPAPDVIRAPDAADLVFAQDQLADIAAGATLAYAYARKVADPELGPSFEDRIRLTVDPSAKGGDARDVQVDFFSPERHRAAGPFDGATTNPVVMLFLENHLMELAGRLKGNPRYFKNAIRAGLRDKASVAPREIEVGGRTFKGWRVSVTPFSGDANAPRMRGLDRLTYRFDVVPDLPGRIARMDIFADAPGGRLWEETIAYDPKGS